VTVPDKLLTISGFARRVGLTPSALRFYDDCGLLRPVHVDSGSGYRYYSGEQEARGLLLRDLREVDLPLADVRAVLDGAPEDAVRILHAHVRVLEGKVGPARKVAALVLDSLPKAVRVCRVTLSGAEFASAARQVVPAAATTDEVPTLACVLLDLGIDEATLAATDRYRMSVRVLQPRQFEGVPRHLLVPAPILSELARWALRGQDVHIDVDARRATLTSGDERREVPTLQADFPDYRGILAGVGPPVTRAIVDRVKLLDHLVDVTSAGTVRLTIGGNHVAVSGIGNDQGTSLDAVCTGPPIRVGFSPIVLGAALGASVGPDVLLELVAPNRPVVVRSADQGTFTTLAMPIRLDLDGR
jgi:DNA polymerase-3 subunit beta